ncbi:MAG: pilus assembly protein [Myxococcota bacterium]
MRRLRRRLRHAWGLAALAAAALAAPAAASDLAILSQSDTAPPNILIMLDSSGSMDDKPSGCWSCSTKRTIAKNALRDLILAVNPPDGSGGYVENARFGLAGFRSRGADLRVPIADGNTQAVLDSIASMTASSVGTPIGSAALDVGRYYSTGIGWGTLPDWGSRSGESVQPSPHDLSCRKSFVIYLSDGLPNKDRIDESGFWATIGDADGDTGSGEGDPENDPSDVDDDDIEWGDDITWAMAHRDFAPAVPGDQNVVTHVIGFDVDTPILERMADNGLGNYYTASSSTQLATALAAATQAVMDSLASFSSAVVPASRTIFGAAFYNAYFEPKVNEPFWPGHLEAYRLSPTGVIEDKDGAPAVDPATGLLNDPPNPFWDAGEVLETDTIRRLYTTIGGAQTYFEKANVSTGDLDIAAADIPFYPNAGSSGVDTLSELRDAIVDYVHGKDAFDEDNDGSSSEMRDVVLGDIFHSTPRVVGAPSTLLVREDGYVSFLGQHSDRDRVIYVGANDGLLHAFDAGAWYTGDDPSTASEVENGYYGAGTGSELFGYVPGQLLDDVKMIPRNSPRSYYYVDGSPVVAEAWLGDGSANDTTKSADEWATVLITGFRQGGPGYIALDVTDPDAMAGDDHGPYPLLLWEFDHAKLGETWSEPIVTRVKVRASAGTGDVCGPDDGDGDCRERWVAIVGGGYEESANPNSAAFEGDHTAADWTDRSRAIFMVALDTGEVLASVEYDPTGADGPSEMLYALPSTPAVLDLDFDGFADVVYVGDLGGQLWKWDIRAVGVDASGDPRVDNWDAGVFFRTGTTALSGGGTHSRSFFDPPSASFVSGALTLALASGERADLSYAGDASSDDNNRFFAVTDPHPVGSLAFGPTLTDADLTDVTNVHTDPDPTDSGFYFKADEGEKFVGSPVVFAGYVIASSYEPATGNDPCGASGTASLYAFRIRDGKGLKPDPTATPMEKRRFSLGGGLPSAPRVSLAPDSENDEIYIKTSKGEILTVDPPDRGDGGASVIYWTRKF